MSKFIILITLTIVSQQIAQTVTLEWVKKYDGIVGGSDKPHGMAVDDSGNVYITGRSAGIHYLDIVTLKYSKTGDLRWAVRYDGGDDDGGYAIAVDNSGNVYVTGYTWVDGHYSNFCTIKYDNLGIQEWIRTYDGLANRSDVSNHILLDDSGYIYVSGWTETGMYNYDFCTIKYDTNGNTKWLATYEGPAHSVDNATGLTKDNTGNIIVTGESVGVGTYYDYCTIKYDQNTGDTLWVARYNGQANEMDSPSDIIVDTLGNIYVTGWSTKDSTLDIFTIKYSPQGSIVWTSRYDGIPYGGEDRAYAMKMDSQQNIYVVGRTEVYENNLDCILIKYDNSGIEKWVRTYGGPANYYDAFVNIDVDTYDNVYTTGYVTSSIITYPYDYNFITTMHNSNGVLEWMQIYGDSANRSDLASLISVDKDFNVYVSGEVDISYNNYDYCTLKYSQPIGIESNHEMIPNNYYLFQNYPNPFNPITKIKFSLPSPSSGGVVYVRLIIYDILGKEVASLIPPLRGGQEGLKLGTYEVDWDASNYPSGVYFYKLVADGYSESRKMVLIK